MAAVNYEMIVKGDEDMIFAYLEGFLLGKGIKDGVYFSQDYPVNESFFRDLLKFHGDVTHIICRARLRASVEAALRRGDEALEIDLVKVRRLRRSSFDFDFNVYNRPLATKLKRVLSSRPKTIKLVDFEKKLKERPDGKGTEAYAPLHEFAFEGKGRIEGEFSEVCRMHEKLSDISQVHTHKINLHT